MDTRKQHVLSSPIFTVEQISCLTLDFFLDFYKKRATSDSLFFTVDLCIQVYNLNGSTGNTCLKRLSQREPVQIEISAGKVFFDVTSTTRAYYAENAFMRLDRVTVNKGICGMFHFYVNPFCCQRNELCENYLIMCLNYDLMKYICLYINDSCQKAIFCLQL